MTVLWRKKWAHSQIKFCESNSFIVAFKIFDCFTISFQKHSILMPVITLIKWKGYASLISLNLRRIQSSMYSLLFNSTLTNDVLWYTELLKLVCYTRHAVFWFTQWPGCNTYISNQLKRRNNHIIIDLN